MKRITSSTVANMNSNELSRLFREVSREHRTEPDSIERAVVGLGSSQMNKVCQ